MKLDNIKSYEIPFCATCGIGINETNDSGWEIFTDKSNKTQPECKM